MACICHSQLAHAHDTYIYIYRRRMTWVSESAQHHSVCVCLWVNFLAFCLFGVTRRQMPEMLFSHRRFCRPQNIHTNTNAWEVCGGKGLALMCVCVFHVCESKKQKMEPQSCCGVTDGPGWNGICVWMNFLSSDCAVFFLFLRRLVLLLSLVLSALMVFVDDVAATVAS